MTNKYVAYMRVSTQKQKNSGLGLEGQKGIIQFYASMNKAEIVQEFVEAESGKGTTNRPILRDAIQLCKDNQYTLMDNAFNVFLCRIVWISHADNFLVSMIYKFDY